MDLAKLYATKMLTKSNSNRIKWLVKRLRKRQRKPRSKLENRRTKYSLKPRKKKLK